MEFMLPKSFQEALQALKDQAIAATAQMLSEDRSVQRAELADAQRRMVLYPIECKSIYQVLLKSKDETLTIETLDETRLAQELGEE